MKRLLYISSFLLMINTGCQHKKSTTNNTSEIEKMDGMTEAIEDSLKMANALALQSKFERIVHPKAQTTPVKEAHGEDAADDPAIWYNAANPNESRVLGTDKKSGLALYNLKGELVDFNPAGKVNNVDLRYNFTLGNRNIAIAAASERISNGLILFEVTADSLISLLKEPIALDSAIIDDSYGCCMYYSRKKQAYYAFVCGKNGNVQQWRIESNANQIQMKAVRQITFASQCEGMAADDEEGILYVAEEGKGIWKLSAEENASNEMTMLANSDNSNEHIAYDLEGLDIYYAGNNKGYLIASIQGNFSYAIFNKNGDNTYLGNFTVKSKDGIDGSEETDGLAVTNIALGDKFPNGLLVVQDGFNNENGKPLPQNFKLVDWADVAKQYNHQLEIAPSHKWWE